jgi:hypothetical protein
VKKRQMGRIKKDEDIFDKISVLIEEARKKIASTINEQMVVLYWNIGKTIKENIMKSDRAEYGKQIVQSLSEKLTLKYERGYSPQNLWYMVQFFEANPILHSLRGEFKDLSWTHIRTLLPLNKGQMELYLL